MEIQLYEIVEIDPSSLQSSASCSKEEGSHSYIAYFCHIILAFVIIMMCCITHAGKQHHFGTDTTELATWKKIQAKFRYMQKYKTYIGLVSTIITVKRHFYACEKTM